MRQQSLFDDEPAVPDEEPAVPLSVAGPVAGPGAGPLVVAATDGSARPNPGVAAGAWWVDEGCWQAVAVPGRSTNNVGELTAIHALLLAVPADRPLHVVYDSTYAQQCVTTWSRGWSRGGRLPPHEWRTKDRQPVKNAELVAATVALLAGRTVTWSKVKSHTTLTTSEHLLNRAADERAAAVVEAVTAGRDPDLGPGWTR